MEYIPIQTRVLRPPKDDLRAALDEKLTDLREEDVVLITSKVVAIDEGRCVEAAGADKETLVKAEAERVIGPSDRAFPLTITRGSFMPAAGIDESNSDGYYTLLPLDPFASAQRIREHLQKKHKVKKLGVIIVDSHLVPLRSGVVSSALGFSGIEPVKPHKGQHDLFGREMTVSATNVADALAAGAGLLMGETDATTPVVVVRNVPGLHFTDADRREAIRVKPEADIFYPLYEQFLKDPKQKSVTAYIGLGANLPSRYGEPPETLRAAIRVMEERGLLVTAASSFYKTAPVPASGDPWFYNAVVCIETELSPQLLLEELLAIEAAFGRKRTTQNAPRVIDLDLLSFGREIVESESLSVPHPRMHERAFVLHPLAELAPEWTHPRTGAPVDALIVALPKEQIIEKVQKSV